MYTDEMPSCGFIFLPSFTKIATGIQAILRFRVISTPLRWAQVHYICHIRSFMELGKSLEGILSFCLKFERL
jgi:hypothetical protein